MVHDLITATEIASAVGGKRQRIVNILRTREDVKILGVVGITNLYHRNTVGLVRREMKLQNARLPIAQ